MASRPEPEEQQADSASLDLVLRPIRSRNLFEDTVGRLAQAIELGIVPAGGRFPPERELAEMLGISRVTVREALRALEQAGRIEIRRGRQGGTFVTRKRVGTRSNASARRAVRELGESLDDLLEYRWAIEPAAASLAAQKAGPADVDHLRKVFDASTETTPVGFRAADARIHLAIAEIAQSAMIAAAVADLQARLSEVFRAIPILDQSISHSHDQHLAVVEAITNGDATLARDMMEEHISASAELIRGLA